MSYVLGTVDRTASDFVANYNVRRGSKGNVVLMVQGILNRVWGASPKLKEDSIFGPLTEAAVRGFQASNGLVVDGVVGPQTSLALQDDDSKEIGQKSSSTLPVTTLPKLPKKSNMLLIGGIVVAGAIGVAIALSGGKKRKNPSYRHRAARGKRYPVWIPGVGMRQIRSSSPEGARRKAAVMRKHGWISATDRHANR